MLDLLATGYPSLDHIVPVSRVPMAGETALLHAPLRSQTGSFGGCGANVAVGLKKLGFSTGVAMVLGADPEGDTYRRYLTEQGIVCDNLIQLDGERTSASYLFRAPDGECVNFFYPGAADAWTGTLSLEGLNNVRHGLVTVGCALYNRAFVDLIAAHDIPLIWQLKADTAAYPRTVLQQFARLSRVIFCNVMETQFLLSALGLDDIRALLAQGVETIVLTAGSEGSRIFTREGDVQVPIVPATVVDTTGAGDAYTAGFLAGSWLGYDPLVCGRLGATCAAFAVEGVGCQSNLPDWERLVLRYRKNFGVL